MAGQGPKSPSALVPQRAERGDVSGRLRPRTGMVLGIAMLLALAGAAPSQGQFQQSTPVYADDSPQAQGALDRARELAAAGNAAEAARVIQQLLDTDAERVVPDRADNKLFTALRDRVHDVLLSSPAVLERYRSVEEPRARDLVAAGEFEKVERARLLTRSGLEAALKVAERHLEAARFEAARLTLEQLETHPDRKDPALADKCAAAARLVARYLDRASVRSWAERWTQEAGKNEPVGAAIVPPPRAAERARNPVSTKEGGPDAPLDAAALVRSPLQSVWISEQIRRDLADRPELHQGNREARARQNGEDEPWMFPTVFGDLVYVTDGSSVNALDRFTLAPVWSANIAPIESDPSSGPFDPSGEESVFLPGLPRQLDDSPTVAVGGGVAVVCSGLPYQNGRDDTQRVHAYDAATGRLLWNVHLAQLGEGFENAGIRGAPIIEGDTLILGVKKTGQARRLLGLYLVGIDIRDGSARWTRLIGSAGVLPRGGGTRIADSPVVSEGVVYRGDEMGVIAAVEAATGRPRWVRTFDPGELRSRELLGSWSTSTPIVDAGRVVTLSPDRRNLLVLEASSGKVLASRDTRSLGDPTYLVRVGAQIACIGSRILSVPFDKAETAAPVELMAYTEDQAQGRVVAAGGKLVVPTREGVMVLDPESKAQPQKVELAHPGNLIPNGEHLLAVDTTRVHSYLVWDRAEKLVKSRIEANPSDPRPAQTYAELAYRAGRTDRLVPAMDLVIKAISADASSPIASAVREQLFTLASEVLARGLRPADQNKPLLSDDSGLELAPPVRELAVLDQVLVRLTRCAESDREQTRALLLTADLRRAQGQTDRAAAAYQEIIQSPALANSISIVANSEVRAEVEATRLLRDLIRVSGARAYASFDAEAARGLAELGAAPTRAALLDLVRRYPAAAQNVDLLTRAADDAMASKEISTATMYLERALVAAEEGVASGRDEHTSRIGDLRGRLVQGLVAQDRPAAALRVIRRLSTQYPRANLAIPAGVEPTIKLIEQQLASISRPARVGLKVGSEVQTLEGWMLLQAIVRERGLPPAEHVLMYAPARKQLGLWAISGDSSGLTSAWSRDVGAMPPTLVRIDGASALLYWPSPSGGELERVDLADGKTLWRSESFDAMVPAGQGGLDPNVRMETPLDGPVKPTDLMVALDDQIAVLVQRGGRLAVVDLSNGKALWNAPIAIDRIFDVTVAGGQVLLAGAAEKPRDDGMGVDHIPVLRAFDSRSGQLVRSVNSKLGHFRWIRPAGDDLAIVGVSDAVIGLDLKSGAEKWVISGEAARLTADAWVIGSKLLLMDQRHDLWLGPAQTGAMGAESISTNSRSSGSRQIRVSPSGDSILFSADRGMLIISPTGELGGMDPLGALTDLVTPVVTDRFAVTAEASLQRQGDQQVFRLMAIDTKSGKLLLQQAIAAYDAPTDLAVLDGRAVVTCGAVTLVIPLQ